jgi:hypothetical protein
MDSSARSENPGANRHDELDLRGERLQRIAAIGATGGLALGTVCCFLFGHLLWMFSCNVYHSGLTFVWMVVGLVALKRGEAAAFNLTNGVFLSVAGVTYFFPELRALQQQYMSTNWAMTGLHVFLAGLQLGTYVYVSRLAATARSRADRPVGFWRRVPLSAFLPGTTLLAIAAVGFVTNHVAGILRLNLNAACYFLSFGLVGILSAGQCHLRGFTLLSGTFFVGLGLLDLVPPLHAAQVEFLNFNGAMSTFLVVFGATAVAASLGASGPWVGEKAVLAAHLRAGGREARGADL